MLDIAPTVLQLFDLPVADDMDGRVITDAFVDDVEVARIPSWDEVPGNDGAHPPERQLDANEANEALEQLVELGYVEPLTDDADVNVKTATHELKFNLARAYIDAEQFGSAVEILHELFSERPSEYRYGIQLAMCFKTMNRTDDLDQLVARLRQQRIADSKKALVELDRYRREALRRRRQKHIEANKDNPEATTEQALAELDQAPLEFKNAIEAELFSTHEREQISRLQGLASVNKRAFDFLEGYSHIAQKRPLQGIKLLQQAIDSQPNRPSLYILIGETYLRQKFLEKAQQAFEKSLELDEKSPQSLLGLARCFLGRHQNEEAAEKCLAAIGQKFHYPDAHYYLGVALHRLDKIDRAIDALKLSAAQNPNNSRAYGRIGYIYRTVRDDPEQSQKYLELATEARAATRQLKKEAFKYSIPEFDDSDDSAVRKYSLKQTEESALLKLSIAQSTPDDIRARAGDQGSKPIVTVVTGLPRTGTSMMMQMLHQGGLEALSDGNRTPDEDNPKGYFELDLTKKLATQNNWVVQAEGKVVKVVAQLLRYLPKDLNYRIIFMNRPLNEVLASQSVMLERNKSKGGNLSDTQLQKVFVAQLQQAIDLLRKTQIRTTRIDYHSVLKDPLQAAEKVKDFLGIDLDTAKMAASVDPSLHRQKHKAPTETPKS